MVDGIFKNADAPSPVITVEGASAHPKPYATACDMFA